MATRSALINVMHKAVTAASRNMLRDFGEVENLQVTRKGPADFVSRVDTNAERVIKAELQKARPDWGFEMEEGGIIPGADADAPCWMAPQTFYMAFRILPFPLPYATMARLPQG